MKRKKKMLVIYEAFYCNLNSFLHHILHFTGTLMGFILIGISGCKDKQEFHWIYWGENSLHSEIIPVPMQSDVCESWHLPCTNKDQKKLRCSFLAWIRFLSKECCRVKTYKPLPRIKFMLHIFQKVVFSRSQVR